MSSRERLIRQLAVKYGLDPEAVVSIASVEGQAALHGGNSIGDHGTSFGPFQLHAGGALPRGKGNSWANSRAGLDYAERQMSQYARGLHGEQAVTAISSRFERPADVRAEIQKAMGFYGHAGSPGGPLPAGAGAPSSATDALSADAFKSMAAAQLISQSMATMQGKPFDPSGLMALAVARKQFEAAHQMYGPTPAKGSLVNPGGKINELFYDPLGGIKNGKQIGAIGHHGYHVHTALGNPVAQERAIAQAQRMGLHVSEDGLHDHVDPVHAKNSYHYRTYGPKYGNLREAFDASGTPQQMAAYYRWVSSNFG